MTDSSEVHSLHQRTLDLMMASDKTVPEIYRDTGIPFYWLRKFRTREIQQPSVNRVQRLYEYLSGHELEV